MDKQSLYLIDAYGLIYRSYFAFIKSPLKNSEQKNISALYGFARSLVSLLDDGVPSVVDKEFKTIKLQKPSYLAAIFDSKTPTFRHKMYSEYKATRNKTPDDLRAQIPKVEKFLSELGIPLIFLDGFEADDVIAALAVKCKQENWNCYIISSDKDLLQLVGDACWALRPVKNNETGDCFSPYRVFGPDEVKAELGVLPDRIIDLLSLTGDSSDNVPGVHGIGKVSACELVNRYGSLEEIYRSIAGIKGATGKKLAEGRDSAFFSRSLIKLDSTAPLPLDSLDALSVKNLNRSAGAKALLDEEIRQIAKQLDPKSASAWQKKSENKKDGSSTQAASDPEIKTSGINPAFSEKGDCRTILNIDEFKKLLDKAKEQKLLALDFETDSLDAWNSRPIGISFSVEPGTGYYLPLASHQSAPFVDPEQVKALLEPFFSDASMTIAAHNAKFDYKVSRGWGIEPWKCGIWDTMVAAWLTDPDRNNYSLGSLALLYYGIKTMAYNDIVPKGSTFDEVSLETACDYSGEDAYLCLRLKATLEEKLKESNTYDLFNNLEMPLLPILAEMEGEGIKIEPGALSNFSVELQDELKNIEACTYKTVGHEFNLSSTQQLQKVLFEERGLTPGKKTKTGFSTDVSVLEELARVDEVPALILRHRTIVKLKSAYVDALPLLADKQGRLHTNFVQNGTATGRLSSREPNLQNIPIRDEEGRRIREAFISEPGSVLISADYSQIELVILAHLSGDPELNAAFTEGKDVHARTAALIFKVDENDINAKQRRIAKTINFGVMYGMSAFRLSNELQISRSEAASFIRTYFEAYSGVRAYIEELIKKTESCGYATTILGRRRYIPTINSSNKTEKAAAERIAVNTPIQGSAADIVKIAMLRIDKSLAAAGKKAKLLLQVHDELIFECKEEAAAECLTLIKNEMENAYPLRVPLRVSVETGKRWGDFH